jgi:hypothetical protein
MVQELCGVNNMEDKNIKLPLAPEPLIGLEVFGGTIFYNSRKEFEKDCIQMKDGRWRRKHFWERKSE